MTRFVRANMLLPHTLLILLSFNSSFLFAEEELGELEYIALDPVIVTNYLKKKSKKPGFVQLKAQLVVRGKDSSDLLTLHMPLVRDYIIDFLSFTEEAVIKDATKRSHLRKSLSKGIQKMLTKEVGKPIIEEVVITHFMWD